VSHELNAWINVAFFIITLICLFFGHCHERNNDRSEKLLKTRLSLKFRERNYSLYHLKKIPTSSICIHTTIITRGEKEICACAARGYEWSDCGEWNVS
jgi:hypothetical protein